MIIYTYLILVIVNLLLLAVYMVSERFIRAYNKITNKHKNLYWTIPIYFILISFTTLFLPLYFIDKFVLNYKLTKRTINFINRKLNKL